MVELYDYQLDAVKKMKNGCILCGGVGSGKSLTSLAYFFTVCGGSLKPYRPMTKPLELYIITTAKKRDSQEWERDMSIFSLSTGKTVVVDSWNNIGKYEDVKGAFFIFDENRISSFGAWSKTLIKIARANNWIVLSATPGDTWMDYMTVFIANGFYRNKTEFVHEHVVYDRFSKYPKVERYLDTERLNYYRRYILVDMDFHRETVQHHEDIFCEWDRAAYKQVMSHWDIWNGRPYKTRAELCYGLRRVTNTSEERAEKVWLIFKEHPRVIIFYNFNYELEILKGIHYGDKVEVAEWNGHVHDDIPRGESWVYLVQYNSCEGWNCITTDTIIFYSQNYSYKTMIQAAGRIDRLNTKYTDLYYYHLKSFASIDVAINRALKNKRKFNENAFVKEFKIV